MKNIDDVINSISEKLGEENTSLIADDLGIIMTNNKGLIEEINTKEKAIDDLTKQKENLIQANGNLLQQVAMGQEEIKETEEKEEKKKFDFKSAFDERGNFIQ